MRVFKERGMPLTPKSHAGNTRLSVRCGSALMLRQAALACIGKSRVISALKATGLDSNDEESSYYISVFSLAAGWISCLQGVVHMC